MLYHDTTHEPEETATAAAAEHVDPQPPHTEAPPVPLAAAPASAVPPQVTPTQKPFIATPAAPQPRLASSEVSANNSVSTAPLTPLSKSVVARPATANGEPVLIGKVVSAESSKVPSARLQPQANPSLTHFTPSRGTSAVPPSAMHSHKSNSSASSSTATSGSFIGDPDKMELLFDFGRYVGQVDPLTGLRDGQGCLHYKSGNVYSGQWRDGAADGFGEKRYENGDIYRGHWDQGKRAGRGAYLFAQGHFYDGMYANDQPDGYGIYTTLQGDRYAGQWKAGHKNGKGRETLVNGQVFVGNWRSGKKQGRGKLYLPGADKYIFGIWNNDKFFRELTGNEMGVDGAEDVVDQFGLPRDHAAPPVPPPWVKAAPTGVTDRVLMGVTALEDRMESFGRALERVMNSAMGVEEGGAAAGGPDGTTPPPPPTGNAGAGTNARPRLGNGSNASSPSLQFASSNQQPANGVLADDVDESNDEEEGEDDVVRTTTAAAAAAEAARPALPERESTGTPPAAVLSTATEGSEQHRAAREVPRAKAALKEEEKDESLQK